MTLEIVILTAWLGLDAVVVGGLVLRRRRGVGHAARPGAAATPTSAAPQLRLIASDEQVGG